jgi:polysaccharide deacetylase 2 family uncharacterized protein YibQ
VSRQVFLDHELSDDFLLRQFNRMKRIAKKKGQVVVIGHPHPQTIAFLQEHLPTLESEGFNLISVADYFSPASESTQALAASGVPDLSVSAPNE